MTLRGLREVEARLNNALRDIEGVTKSAFMDVVLDLTGEAVRRAPVLDGDLRGSGKAEINSVVIAMGTKEGTIETTGEMPEAVRYEATVSFGTPYARYQHEGLDFKHPQGGQAKYLQQPFEEKVDRYIQHMRDSVRRETR
jgi:hypothetical protein